MNNRCQYPIKCNSEALSDHHIIPVSFGGLDNRENLIPLCKTHHNLVEGFCGKCAKAVDCHESYFYECFRFEDALPPIHWCNLSYINETYTDLGYDFKCPVCSGSDVTRIDLWDINIWSKKYRSLFYCHENHVFYIVMSKEQYYKCIDKIKVKFVYFSEVSTIYRRVNHEWISVNDISEKNDDKIIVNNIKIIKKVNLLRTKR